MDNEIPQQAGPDRRDALRQLAGGALALVTIGATACVPGAGAAAPATTPARASAFDMSWLQRINRRRRTVFDTNDVSGGAGLGFVAAYLSGAKDAYGDPDASTVLALRHTSVPVALNDEMWRRLALGESFKAKDPTTGETAVRNPFIGYKAGDRFTMTGPDAGLDVMMKNGMIVIACNRALMGYASMLANKEKIDREQARREMTAAVLPGVYLVPNGVFGVCAAQEAGCGYIAVR